MTRLLLLLLLALPACADGEAAAPPASAEAVDGVGSPLRTPAGAGPGPEGDDPPCTAFAASATCTRVGDVVWVLQADGGSWQLTSYAVDDELGRWVPALQGSGGGLSPTVTEVDLSDDEQPEALVVYGGGFDVVSSQEAGAPQVVVHGEGKASVEDEDEDEAVVAGDREVRQVEGRWVSVPVGAGR